MKRKIWLSSMPFLLILGILFIKCTEKPEREETGETDPITLDPTTCLSIKVTTAESSDEQTLLIENTSSSTQTVMFSIPVGGRRRKLYAFS